MLCTLVNCLIKRRTIFVGSYYTTLYVILLWFSDANEVYACMSLFLPFRLFRKRTPLVSQDKWQIKNALCGGHK